MTETWVKVERLDRTQELTIEVDIPDDLELKISRDEYRRLLSEAGYTRDSSDKGRR